MGGSDLSVLIRRTLCPDDNALPDFQPLVVETSHGGRIEHLVVTARKILVDETQIEIDPPRLGVKIAQIDSTSHGTAQGTQASKAFCYAVTANADMSVLVN